MKQIFSDLWNGNIAPVEVCGKDNYEIKKLVFTLDKNEEEINRVLNAEQKIILEKYTDNLQKLWLLNTEEAFGEGFSLGCKFMCEALK